MLGQQLTAIVVNRRVQTLTCLPMVKGMQRSSKAVPVHTMEAYKLAIMSLFW